MSASRRTPLGRLSVRGHPDLLDAAGDAALEACAALDLAGAPHRGGPDSLAGRATWFKGTRLTGRASLRHALRRACLRRPLPYEREARNLAWLRAHGFGAPEPLASGGLWRGPLPRFQFLFTRAVPNARRLDELLATTPDRAPLLTALGAEVRRLHRAGFAHRDLFARNVLVREEGGFVFLDTRRGGRPLPGRGRGYDLACLAGDLGPAAPTFLLGYGN